MDLNLACSEKESSKMRRTQGEKESLVRIILYLEHFTQIEDNIRKTGKFQNRMILTLANLADLCAHLRGNPILIVSWYTFCLDRGSKYFNNPNFGILFARGVFVGSWSNYRYGSLGGAEHS